MSKRTEISLQDIEGINQKFLFEKVEEEHSRESGVDWITIIIAIVLIILLIGLVIYFLEENEKKKKEIQIKNKDGSIRTVKKEVSTLETESAVEKLIAT